MPRAQKGPKWPPISGWTKKSVELLSLLSMASFFKALWYLNLWPRVDKKTLSREDRRHSCDDDSSLYGFDMAVKQTVSTHVSSLSVDVININRSTESRCAANFYMGTLFVFSDSWSYLLEENTWLTINQGIDTYSPIPQSNTLNVGRGREFMYPIHVKKYST